VNIFVSDSSPWVAARNLDAKRVVKMVLESAQMLSTAVNQHGGKAPYKSTHINHPANVWARENRENYMWLLQHFSALCKTYSDFYEKTHKCEHYLTDFTILAQQIPDGEITPFANCSANAEKCVSFKHVSDTILAYQFYLVARWNTDKRKPEWLYRGFKSLMPKWVRVVNGKYYHIQDPAWVALYGGKNEKVDISRIKYVKY
jgi:hypothetical protein